jgi:hypothetical protein
MKHIKEYMNFNDIDTLDISNECNLDDLDENFIYIWTVNVIKDQSYYEDIYNRLTKNKEFYDYLMDNMSVKGNNLIGNNNIFYLCYYPNKSEFNTYFEWDINCDYKEDDKYVFLVDIEDWINDGDCK